MNPVLKLLIEGGSLSPAQMAQVAGLSESEINQHLEQLKKEKVFLGWRPVLDLSREAAARSAAAHVLGWPLRTAAAPCSGAAPRARDAGGVG